MQWSKYNILFESKLHGYLLYNTFSNCFIELEESLYSVMKKIELGRVTIDNAIEKDTISRLSDQKIFISFKDEEYYDIKLKTHFNRYQSNLLGLTIAPTLNCNFNCVYCYEEGVENSSMDDKTLSHLINFIIDKSKQSKDLSICWYGGEPLMAFEQIKKITSDIKDHFRSYSASIITNGYLLTEEKAKDFIQLNINFVQITIDGTDKIHDERRHLKNGKGTFKQIIQNIEYLLAINNKINIAIRVNIDDKNELEYHNIYTFLNQKFDSKRLSVYPGFVNKTNSTNCKSTEDDQFGHQKKADFQINNYMNYGVTTNFFPLSRFGECIARCKNKLLIDPKGDIYKCWEDVGDTIHKIGNISSNELNNKEILISYLTIADQFEDKICIDCKILPICGGGCPKKRLLNKEGNVKIDLCHPMKNNIESFLDIYYSIKKKNIIDN